MYYENENYLSKKNKPKPNKNQSNIFFIKFPPTNEIQLKSIILQFLLNKDLILPISSKEILERIKFNFSYNKNILFLINKINYKKVFEELSKINIFKCEKVSFGLKCYNVIFKINIQKLAITNGEFYQFFPKEMPQIEYKYIGNDLIISNKDNKLKELLSEPTGYKKNKLKELDLIQRNKQNNQIRKFVSKSNNIKICEFGTKEKCFDGNNRLCEKIHHKKIIFPHTDETLGNCNYLNKCNNIKFCEYLHYEIDEFDKKNSFIFKNVKNKNKLLEQWINCDLMQFDLSILGKFNVIMLDPPWNIKMNLPYGILNDNQMKFIKVENLIDEGICFLWVTGRTMELGRECLKKWGFKKVEEIVWIKLNQIQNVVRTGRTGHWLNHSKEHCLVGIKSNPKINRNLDCDVIVSQVRETSRKPDEIYDLIERFHPNGRKIELFARPCNRRPGWLSWGNQLPGNYIVEEEIIKNFEKATGKKLNLKEMEENKNKSLKNEKKFNKTVYYGN